MPPVTALRTKPATAALFALATLAATSAHAAEVTILSGGAAKAGLLEVILAFEAATGHKVKAEFAPMGALVKRLSGGDKPDVVVVTEDVLPDVAAKGMIAPGSTAEVGRVGVGVAVKADATAPDISTPEAFKAALLAAKSIVMIDPATGTSGRHVAKVFADLGITDALKEKTKYLQGGYVVEPVGRGEIELGLHQITEILPVPGVKLVGPLPAPLQKVTVYVAGVGASAPNADAAKAFVALLAKPDIRAKLTAKGFMAAQ